MNRKRCGDGDELSYVGYARVNSSVFSLALKVPRILAVLMQWRRWEVHGLFVPWTVRTLVDCSYHELFVPSLDDSYRVEKGNIVYTV